MTSEPSYLHLLAARQAEATLMSGFTTVRDLGGPVFGLKRAIDEGVMVGPRIYPSGAMISQTSGHGDFRFLFELPRKLGGPLSNSEVDGIAAIADSPDEVRLRSREQLRAGASQIKLMGGGGVSSPLNPIESTQFTEPEIRAAVEAAENWGTYVTVHAYTPRSIRQGIAAGVKCIEHGHLIDEPTAKLMADKGVWWSLQPLRYDEGVFQRMSPVSQKKALQVWAGTDNAYKLAKKYKIKTAWGADILFDPGAARRHGTDLSVMVQWYTPAEALKMATADNGELMALSGFINPYPGKLGVVQEGALADLLLVDSIVVVRRLQCANCASVVDYGKPHPSLGAMNPVVASDKLKRTEVWAEDDESVHWAGAFAVYGGHGATASSTIVYEIEPGKRLGWHTDATEETQYIIAGTGELHMEDGSTYRVGPGSVFAIPTPVKHDLVNVGKETLRAVAFFAAAMFTQNFDNVMMPPKSHILGTPNREG